MGWASGCARLSPEFRFHDCALLEPQAQWSPPYDPNHPLPVPLLPCPAVSSVTCGEREAQICIRYVDIDATSFFKGRTCNSAEASPTLPTELEGSSHTSTLILSQERHYFHGVNERCFMKSLRVKGHSGICSSCLWKHLVSASLYTRRHTPGNTVPPVSLLKIMKGQSHVTENVTVLFKTWFINWYAYEQSYISLATFTSLIHIHHFHCHFEI